MASFDGFINLLYECFLLEQIRQDDKLKERISKEKILSKIQTLPIYCHGFIPSNKLSKQWKHKFNSKIKDYGKLMTIRNTLVHANLFKLRYTNMIEEDTFLFYNDFVQKDNLFGVSTEDTIKRWTSLLQDAKATILSLIQVLIMRMETEQRRQFRRIYKDYWIGYVYTGKDSITFVREELR